MNFVMLFFILCISVIPIIYWRYSKKIEIGDVYAFNSNNNDFVRVDSVSKHYVYYEHKKEIKCMEKSSFLTNFHKIDFYV